MKNYYQYRKLNYWYSSLFHKKYFWKNSSNSFVDINSYMGVINFDCIVVINFDCNFMYLFPKHKANIQVNKREFKFYIRVFTLALYKSEIFKNFAVSLCRKYFSSLPFRRNIKKDILTIAMDIFFRSFTQNGTFLLTIIFRTTKAHL